MLTEAKIKACPIPDKGVKKLFDTHGLYLQINPNGSKYWRYSYFFYGKVKTLALGVYPFLSLKEARNEHLKARKLLLEGLEPCSEKQRLKQQTKTELLGNTFAEVFNEWYQLNLSRWKNEKHKWQVKNNFERYVLPYIGKLAIKSITPMQIFNLLQKMSDKTETMTRTKQRIKAIFDYAMMTGRGISYNPASVMPKMAKKQVVNQPSLPQELIPQFFERLDKYPNQRTKLALKLLILTFVRNSELRLGQWSEIKGDEWHIPAERMKMKRHHIVPLSDWALEILEELKKYSQNHLIIHGRNQQPISDATLSLAMRRMGYGGIATPHGFRAMASTILNENGFNPDAIERQLAHAEQNEVRAAYNRAEYLSERKLMMQWYSDYIKSKISN